MIIEYTSHKLCLRSSSWYYLFVFYSLMTYTETFYLMETTTTSNMFANYGASKKKDYKAELLKELAAEEDLFFATSTIHFSKRVKNMKCKYFTDSDPDEATTAKIDLITGSSKIQNISISLKKKTLKTFDSLWNMMRTISDDTLNIDKPSVREKTTPFKKLQSNDIYSTKSVPDEEDSDFQFINETKDYKYLAETPKVPSKSKNNKRFGKKKKIKPSKHKRKKGFKSNSTDDISNIINISVRRVMSTPVNKCKSNQTEIKIVKEIKSPYIVGSGDKNVKTRLTKWIKPLEKRTEQCYKVNNTILLNLNNNGGCSCRGTTIINCKESSTLYDVIALVATVTNSTRIVNNIPTVTDNQTTVTDIPTKVTDNPTEVNDNPTTVTDNPTEVTDNPTTVTKSQTSFSNNTNFRITTTQLTRKTTPNIPKKTTILPKATSTVSSIRTKISSIANKNSTTESDECPDFFPCGFCGMKRPMPCCSCSNSEMKGLNKMHEKKGLFSDKCSRKRKKYNRTCHKSSKRYAFGNTLPSNVKSSKQICCHFKRPSTVSSEILLPHQTPRCTSKSWKKASTLKYMRKRVTSLPSCSSKHLSASNLFSRMRKRCSFSTSAKSNDRANLNRRKCTKFSTKHTTTVYLQIRPSLTDNTDVYEDDVKDTEYYEQYYEGYDDCTKVINALTNDGGNQDVQELRHYDIEGSTMLPDDDPALSAFNLLNLFPFNRGKSLTTGSDYEEKIYRKYASDLNPDQLESVAKKIYSLAVKLKNDLEGNRLEQTFTKRKEILVKRGIEHLKQIHNRCNYLLREININRKACIRKLQQLLELTKVRDQVEKRIKGKLHQIIDSLKRRNLK